MWWRTYRGVGASHAAQAEDHGCSEWRHEQPGKGHRRRLRPRPRAARPRAHSRADSRQRPTRGASRGSYYPPGLLSQLIHITVYEALRAFHLASPRPLHVHVGLISPLYRIKTLKRCGASKAKHTNSTPPLPAAALVRAAVRQDARSGRAAPAHIRAPCRRHAPTAIGARVRCTGGPPQTPGRRVNQVRFGCLPPLLPRMR